MHANFGQDKGTHSSDFTGILSGRVVPVSPTYRKTTSDCHAESPAALPDTICSGNGWINTPSRVRYGVVGDRRTLTVSEKEHVKTMHMCVDCAEYCALAAKLSACQSPFSAAACDGCAKTCDECAKECEKFKDDKHMVDCAKSCRDCAKSCRTMIEHLKH
jgi:hypothetical protein